MANTVFNNKVIEAKVNDLLTTSVNTRNLMAVDTSLTENAGMIKTINTYTYTGEAEELGVGEGNSTFGSIGYVGKDYTVKMVQHPFRYQDEDFMKDNTIVDNGIKQASNVITNKMTADFVAELEKATLIQPGTFTYDTIVDAIAKLNLENEGDLFIITDPAGKAEIRKDDDYVAARLGEVVYNGQVGTVAGIPVIVSKAVNGTYILSKEAIKLFLKKDVEIEQNREVNTRTNEIFFRVAYICALVDATKICKIGE